MAMIALEGEMIKLTDRRDMISLREFSPLSIRGIEEMSRTFSIADMDGASIEEWAKMFFLMRQMDDNDALFPSGKWATIQRLEGMLDDYANGVVMK